MSVETFAPDGRPLRFIAVRHTTTSLALDGPGRLYLSCPAGGHVHVYSPDGDELARWDLRRHVQPSGIAFGPSGTCWVVGQAPAGAHGHRPG